MTAFAIVIAALILEHGITKSLDRIADAIKKQNGSEEK